jgi:hypothetical protein
VLKNKDLISSKVLSRSSNLLSFIFFQRHYKRHEGIIFHTVALGVLLAVHQQAYKSTNRLSITQDSLNRLKKIFHNPHSTSNLTMKEKMIYGLPFHFTHTTPIDHDDVPLLEIVHGKNLS